MRAAETLNYQSRPVTRRRMPYWACLLLIPAAWAAVFIQLLPGVEWGADADPDHTVDFYIFASLFVGTPLGLLGALVLMLLMILVGMIRKQHV